MSRLNLRQRPRISYYEPEEPNLDEYIFCTDCADYVYEYCAIHGPLLVIPDDKVPAKTNLPAIVPRAAFTVPHVFLHLARSIIPEAGLGVFTTLTLPRGVRFGPYRGLRTDNINSTYCWQIYDGNKKPSHVIDAVDPNRSNWMRYVNCARHWCEQNLIAYQYRGQIYYRTIRIVPRYTELMVFYGSEFANLLHVDLKRYNSPSSFAEKMGAAKCNKSATRQPKKFIAPLSAKQQKDPSVTSAFLENPSQLVKSIKLNKRGNSELIKKSKNCKSNGTPNTQNSKVIDKSCIPTKKAKCNDTITMNNLKLNNETQLKSLSIQKTTPPSQAITAEETIECNYNHSCKKDVPVNNISNKAVIRLTPNYKLSCDICPYLTTNRLQLSSHLKAHASNKSFVCNTCHYKTINKIHLKQHLRVHSGEKPYSCDVCKRTFNQLGSLKKHLRIHTGEKPYSCDVCKRTFNQLGSLKIHLRIHTGEKPYSCDVCKRTFNQLGRLKIHLRIHTGEKPYPCDVCKRTFNELGSLKKHLRIHTGEKPYSCDVCKQDFRYKSNLKLHLKIHSKELSDIDRFPRGIFLQQRTNCLEVEFNRSR